jgi:hypothetical protein
LNSILFFYEAESKDLRKVSESRFPRLRDVVFDPIGNRWVVVGNIGTILTLEEEEDSKISKTITSVKENLRGVDVNRKTGEILAVGNKGIVLGINSSNNQSVFTQKWREGLTRISKDLRRVKWSPNGKFALAVGNEAAVARIEVRDKEITLEEITPSSSQYTNHFRGVAWNKEGDKALIIGNNFGSEFVPAASIILYEDKTRSFTPIKEADGIEMVSLSPKPNSFSVTIAGYQLVFFWGFFFDFDWETSTITKSLSTEDQEFVPTGIDWNRRKPFALLSSAKLKDGVNAISEYNGKSIKQIKTLDYPPVKVCWDSNDGKALVVVSTSLSIFSE